MRDSESGWKVYWPFTARTRKRLISLLSAALLVCALSSAASAEYTLPIDLTGGKPLNAKYFGKGWKYEDPTIKVSVTQGRSGECDYWVADIRNSMLKN